MRNRWWLGSVLGAILLIVATAWLGVQRTEVPAVSNQKVRFDGERALEYTRQLATGFPRRSDLHPDRARAAQWLREQFTAMGLRPETQSFSEVIAGKRYEGLENVYAVVPGQSEEIVVVVGHYDIPPFVEQGAADDASGVGAVLELARVFQGEKPGRTLLFMASDSEEWGMWGSAQFLQNSALRGRIVAAVSLDYLNMGQQAGITLLNAGLQQGYAPPWLRELALASIRPETAALEPDPLMEWVERSVVIGPTDHVMYLREGIPALNLRGVPVDKAWQKAIYHTPGDRIENLSPLGMARYGRSAERLLRSLAEAPALPAQSMRYLGLGGGRYLAGWSVALIQLWVFLPLGAAVWQGWANWRRRRDLGVAAAPLPALLRLAGLALPLLLGFAVLKLLPEVGLMVKYELYPATQKDPVLANPQWGAVLLVALAVAAGFLAVRRWTRWLAPLESDWAMEHTVALTGLLGLILVVWAFGAGFAAVSFLTLPALLWPFYKPGARVRNLLLWALGASVFVVFVVLFNLLYSIGAVWWYMLMGASYGLFRVQAVLAFLAGVTLHGGALWVVWGRREAVQQPERAAAV